ncbi:hypothetical protein BDP55DRAFT_639213 [Colletotrichum godetiae]|uniref:Uncharacterized protein n=1 Tax=Colletotrichum godetiae TaxID=1209918 RepID=A0AAJ0EMU4_9PEZI|nr:uncharacterized protein BDP55DRAFT_639213 [Colletotrichum godetiae]KAK1656912.1 hypothetical protein BDP55DRAFT_639213 [Colletotrichum godetiae]
MSTQSLHARLPALNCPVNLSYEIFLHIVDAMVSESCEVLRYENATYTLDYQRQFLRSQFSIVLEDRWDPEGVKIQERRWNEIRTLLQVDKTSRRMVRQVFVPSNIIRVMYSQQKYDSQHKVGWFRTLPGGVLPDTDIFEIAPDAESIMRGSFSLRNLPQPE